MRNCILWCEAKSAVTQHWQKDLYDKDIRHSTAETKWLKQINSIDSGRDQLEITEHVTDITYPVKKVRGHSRRSQVVHFNNLRTVVPGKAERMHGEPAARGSVNSSHGEGRAKTVNAHYQGQVRQSQWSRVWLLAEQTKKLLMLGPMMTFLVRLWTYRVRGQSKYRPCLEDTVLVREFEHGGECDQGVDISDTEGGGLTEDV